MNGGTALDPSHWRLEGWHAVADDGTRRTVYVRALIDWGSHEFRTCPLSYRERLAIIESIGEGQILAAMAEIAEMKQRTYAIEVHGKSDLEDLRRSALSEKAKTHGNSVIAS